MQLHDFVILVAAAASAVSAMPSPAPGWSTYSFTNSGGNDNNNGQNQHYNINIKDTQTVHGSTVKTGNVNFNYVYSGNVVNGVGSQVGGIVFGDMHQSTHRNIAYQNANGIIKVTGTIEKNGQSEIESAVDNITLECDKEGVVSGKINDITINKIVGKRDGIVDIKLDREGKVSGSINGVRVTKVNDKISDSIHISNDKPMDHASDRATGQKESSQEQHRNHHEDHVAGQMGSSASKPDI